MNRAVGIWFALVAMLLVLLVGGDLSLVAAQSAGRDVEVTAPPSPPAPTPGLGLEATRPPEERRIREQEFYPGWLVRSTHDPAFITPFDKAIPTSPTEEVHIGLSGWTAPAIPYDIPQNTGGVAFGLTFSWWTPRPVKAAPAPESPPPGQR